MQRDWTSSGNVEFRAGPAQLVTDLRRDSRGTRTHSLSP
jgi:hypothetical protein